MLDFLKQQLERECIDKEVELASIQSDIESRFPKLEMLQNQKAEAEKRLQNYELNVKDMRYNETELESEMVLLLRQKDKRLAERVNLY